jgi:pimeloyl-ACP methyl ester carboxylesterase
MSQLSYLFSTTTSIRALPVFLVLVLTISRVHAMTVDAPAAVAGHSSRDELKNALPDPTRASLEYEESQWATGSVLDDPFYTVPQGSEDAAPGTLIKVEKKVNTSLFTIPPATALSRFVFQSKTFNGSSVPVSGFVLWPYSPRRLPDGFPIVAWAHGTSGLAPNCAPSHIKNLWQHFLGPYQLALQGYVLIAVDYAGLGVGKDGSGKQIVHEYLASPSHANDVIYGVQAAQSAFPELSQKFVVVGHSQGGGAAWAAAQRQALDPVEGYLGAVAVAPVTKVLAEPDPSLLVGAMLPGIAALFPNFQPKDILTPEGAERLDLIAQIGGCVATGFTLLTGVQLLKSDWSDNPFVQEYQRLTVNGGKKIEGPLLVIHGEADSSLSVEGSTKAVKETLELFPSSQLDFVRLPGISHVPALTASQRLWMDWIGDRFAGLKADPKHNGTKLASTRSISSYQPELNWYIEQATQFYQTV